MILTGPAIQSAVERGEIVIAPFSDEQLNPASYDLRLDDEILTYEFGTMPYDVREEPRVRRLKIEEAGFVIRPGIGYLMSTRERIYHPKHVAIVDGKSSLGRLFIAVHCTAGYGDTGFDGNYTLEVTTIYPIRIYAGMRIAQIRFHAVEGAIEPYAGNYVGDRAKGPVASRAWRQFASAPTASSMSEYIRLKDLVLTMSMIGKPLTNEERFDFVYGNLAASTDHKPQRAAFQKLAFELGVDSKTFTEWASKKEWW